MLFSAAVPSTAINVEAAHPETEDEARAGDRGQEGCSLSAEMGTMEYMPLGSSVVCGAWHAVEIFGTSVPLYSLKLDSTQQDASRLPPPRTQATRQASSRPPSAPYSVRSAPMHPGAGGDGGGGKGMPRHHPRPASASSLAFGIQGTGPASSLAFGAALPRVGNEWSTSSCVKPLSGSRSGGMGGGGGSGGMGSGGGDACGSGSMRWQPPRPVKRLPGGRITPSSSTSALLGPHVRKQSRRYMVQGAGCSTSALLGPYVHKQIQPGSTAPMATHGQLTLLPTPSDESLDRHSNSVSGHPSALVWSVPELLVEARGEGGGGGRDGDGP